MAGCTCSARCTASLSVTAICCAAAVAALILGFLFGRGIVTPAPTSIDAAMAPSEGPGLAAFVTATDPPDASVVFASFVEQQ